MSDVLALAPAAGGGKAAAPPAGSKAGRALAAKKAADAAAAKRSSVLYLGHLPKGFEEEQLRSYFAQFGDVTRVRVSRSKKTARPRGYAYVEFAGERARRKGNAKGMMGEGWREEEQLAGRAYQWGEGRGGGGGYRQQGCMGAG